MINTHVHPAGVAAQVVYPIGGGSTQSGDGEVVHRTPPAPLAGATRAHDS